jgi:hypothetical protein
LYENSITERDGRGERIRTSDLTVPNPILTADVSNERAKKPENQGFSLYCFSPLYLLFPHELSHKYHTNLLRSHRRRLSETGQPFARPIEVGRKPVLCARPSKIILISFDFRSGYPRRRFPRPPGAPCQLSFFHSFRWLRSPRLSPANVSCPCGAENHGSTPIRGCAKAKKWTE